MRGISILSFILGAFCVTTAWADLDQPRDARAWVSFRNLTASDYQAKLDAYKAKGYRPVDVEVFEGSRWSIILRKNEENLGWAVHSRLTSEQFHEKWDHYRSRGFRPIDQESYRSGGRQFYAGVWVDNPARTAWSSFRNVTSDQFHNRFRNLRDRGFIPVDVDAYKIAPRKLRYAAVWVKNTENRPWALFRNIRREDFGAHFREWQGKGYRLYDTNSYRFGGRQLYAVIWVKDGRRWHARRDMDSNSFHNWWARYRDEGYRLEDVEMYRMGNGIRYAGAWVENNSARLDWEARNSVDAVVRNYLRNNPAQGLSVAISRGGQSRFIKGYGFADRGANRWASSRTVYRLASVSKAVSGTLGFILRDFRGLDLGDPIRTYLPGLPRHHTYDLEDTLTNRSGVRHYINNDPVNRAGQVASAWQAVRLFMNDPLSSRGYLYSTHAYSVFAAAVEAETDRPFCSEVVRWISNRSGAGSLRCEVRSRRDSERAALYAARSNGTLREINADNLSWKYAGGGMEASAWDLMQFGEALDAGRLLRRQSVEEMITAPDGANTRYAYGWDIGTRNGHRVYAKSGSQPGARSHIRIFPDDDLVIVLLTNTRGSGVAGLGRQLADTVFSFD